LPDYFSPLLISYYAMLPIFSPAPFVLRARRLIDYCRHFHIRHADYYADFSALLMLLSPPLRRFFFFSRFCAFSSFFAIILILRHATRYRCFYAIMLSPLISPFSLYFATMPCRFSWRDALCCLLLIIFDADTDAA